MMMNVHVLCEWHKNTVIQWCNISHNESGSIQRQNTAMHNTITETTLAKVNECKLDNIIQKYSTCIIKEYNLKSD